MRQREKLTCATEAAEDAVVAAYRSRKKKRTNSAVVERAHESHGLMATFPTVATVSPSPSPSSPSSYLLLFFSCCLSFFLHHIE